MFFCRGSMDRSQRLWQRCGWFGVKPVAVQAPTWSTFNATGFEYLYLLKADYEKLPPGSVEATWFWVEMLFCFFFGKERHMVALLIRLSGVYRGCFVEFSVSCWGQWCCAGLARCTRSSRVEKNVMSWMPSSVRAWRAPRWGRSGQGCKQWHWWHSWGMLRICTVAWYRTWIMSQITAGSLAQGWHWCGELAGKWPHCWWDQQGLSGVIGPWNVHSFSENLIRVDLFLSLVRTLLPCPTSLVAPWVLVPTWTVWVRGTSKWWGSRLPGQGSLRILWKWHGWGQQSNDFDGLCSLEQALGKERIFLPGTFFGVPVKLGRSRFSNLDVGLPGPVGWTANHGAQRRDAPGNFLLTKGEEDMKYWRERYIALVQRAHQQKTRHFLLWYINKI